MLMEAIKRATASYEPQFSRFRFTETRKTFIQQYAGIYFARLAQMRKILEDAAVKKWKSRICDSFQL